ncbi:uncharacterized protein LOC136077977 [Hydra vulgaris]|uniref:Uncharacterized protein LOC136077977 n=1 Tax=Hydra vulgaris TaxID=6087 RepID=A0ABM4BHP3_HYDVU
MIAVVNLLLVMRLIILLLHHKMVAVLVRACCNHPKKSIYEVMNKLITKDVASNYNIKGTSQKCNFCIEFKNVYSAVIEAVRSQHADAKDIQLHSFMGEWLRQAGVLNIRTEKKKIENHSDDFNLNG